MTTSRIYKLPEFTNLVNDIVSVKQRITTFLFQFISLDKSDRLILFSSICVFVDVANSRRFIVILCIAAGLLSAASTAEELHRNGTQNSVNFNDRLVKGVRKISTGQRRFLEVGAKTLKG